MSGDHSLCSIDTATNTIFDSSRRRTAASYELELTRSRCAAERLEKAHALDEKLLREKDEQIRQRDLLSHESDHRLLNEMQMIVSLLSLQSRKSKNTEVAFQLTAAADRIATIGRVHRRLHSFDGVSILSLKQYLHDLCRDYSTMLACDDDVQRLISVEGPEIDLPASTGIPLNSSSMNSSRTRSNTAVVPSRSDGSFCTKIAARSPSPMTAQLCRKGSNPLLVRAWE